jgi:hypothetical protein
MPGFRLRQPRHTLHDIYRHLFLLAAAFALLWTVDLGPLWPSDRQVADTTIRSTPPVPISPAQPRLS